MNQRNRVVADMAKLVAFFLPHCTDRVTLDDLQEMLADARRWKDGHDLFDRIRDKTLVADRQGNRARATQYLFEEVCAKTLYNMSLPRDPFDADSAYWITPNAFALARALELDERTVVAIVAA